MSFKPLNINCILFDCMETLVDLTDIPVPEDYSFWAFNGSGTEKYWDSFEEFFQTHQLARKKFNHELPMHKEYGMEQIFSLLIEMNHSISNELSTGVRDKLLETYWGNYISRCYVKEEVKEVLPRLANHFRLGVVSNFKVERGIEKLLKINEINNYFDFVITSVDNGWRKPHPNI
ncbi:HAD hydrolase-like protein [Lederbergia sp. NSJ-179]|uniref:HAD family hydrolase n=1 Tax=Lederbergia sp. NSJ-179 TaxID=2931402 RepID=UPI001FD42144|nr:HAD hydrolase-like protein [Lederbergia sp. NSJ-179]MCJ7842798.1 HAD hydrolase-like protein [Lederbergia sp. NSJ-179]